MPSIFKSSKKNKGSATATTGPFALSFPSSHKAHGHAKAHRVPSASSLKGYGGQGEFGALPRGHSTFPSPPPSPEAPTTRGARSHLHSHPAQAQSFQVAEDAAAPPLPPKFVFLPTRIPRRSGSPNSADSFNYSSDDVKALAVTRGEGGGGGVHTEGDEPKYGFLQGVGAGVVLGLEDVKGVVVDVAAELESRGLTTPLLFSTQALEANQARTTLLIQAYLDSISQRGTNSPSSRTISAGFRHDLKYAKEFELAWLLRWALSRVLSRAEGTKEALRGLMEWEAYEEWRGRERSGNYPIEAFPYLSALIPSQSYAVIRPLFHLLSRFVAHSHLSGLTPHALSSLFAPLLFHIPCNAPALAAHSAFVKAANATEHLLLSYIRSTSSSLAASHAAQAMSHGTSSEKRSSHLGISDLPPRLKEWVTGYPRMIASDADLARGHSRAGAKMVRCERASRTVRAYSRDLVASSESWASEPDAADWDAWKRVTTSQKADAGRPRYTTAYKQKMRVKEVERNDAAGPTEYGASVSTLMAARRGAKKPIPLIAKVRDEEQEGRWGSLAGREWSMFEEGGFGSNVGEKLGFDLTESAKMTVSQKRSTMSWTDFASADGGFTRTDPGLSSTLTHFSPPVATSIAQWPAQRTEMVKRLDSNQKDMVPFQWDTRPRFGVDARDDDGYGVERQDGIVEVEAAFIDFWADLGMGAGWIDRGERTFREANWIFVEYRAAPKGNAISHPREDPRTAELCFLYEERVPQEYQYAIANPAQKRTFNLFSRKKRPPMPPTSSSGSAARLQSALRSPAGPLGLGGLGLGKTTSRSPANQSPSGDARAKGPESSVAFDPKEAEFDRMLMSNTNTKRVQLSKGKEEATIWHKTIDPPLEPLKSLSASTGPSGQTSTTSSPAKSSTIAGPQKFPTPTRSPPAPPAADPAPIPVAALAPAVQATPTFNVVSRDRAQSIGQPQLSRSNQASEEEDEIRTPDMSRDETYDTSPVVVAAGGHSPIKYPTLGPEIRSHGHGSPQAAHLAAMNAHTALQQLSLASSSPADDPYSQAKPSKPLPLAPRSQSNSPRVIQPPALTDREARARQESGSDRVEVLAPSPRPPSRDSAGMLEAGLESGYFGSASSSTRGSGYEYGARDTIHGIVDDYGRNETPQEAREEDGEEEEEEAGYDYDDEGNRSPDLEYLHGQGGQQRAPLLRVQDEEEKERIRFRPVSDIEGEDGEFRPPGPLFDIAPTREPSPGRYQHGLPLHHGESL